MKKSVFVLLSTLMVSISLIGQTRQINNTEVIKIPMKASQWEFQAGKVEFITHKGVPAMKMLENSGYTIPKDVLFENGTIEFDLELIAGSFVGMSFRRQSGDESEYFYLRPYRAGNPMGEDAAQYAPIIKGVNLWDMLYEYQGPADIKKTGWNHIKLVVSGRQLLVYVNNMDQPTLAIPELLGNIQQGGLSFNGNIILANIEIKPNEVEGLAAMADPDPTRHDLRYLRKWQVTKPVLFPFGKDIINEDLPNETTKWEPITAERLGLVNLTRVYGKAENNKRRLVWLKTTITAEQDQRVRLDLGFSDEVWVIINQGLLHIDKNYYNSPIMKAPKGRCSVENTNFEIPLRKGENELLIGVANSFFGWGIIARLAKLDGLTFELP